MLRYLLRRFLASLPVLFGVVTIVFFLLHLVPGDPVDMMLGEAAMPAQREDLRRKLHLDQPLASQYVNYIGALARGNLGESIWTNEPVAMRIAEHYPATLILASVALVIAVLISIPLGLSAAAKRGSAWDGALMTLSLIGLSMPAFWLGPLLILAFAYHLSWFPISGREELSSVVLPALTLGTGMAALLTRMTRASVAEIMKESYVRTAWAKGMPRVKVWGKHTLRNALLPVITIIGLQAGGLLAGSIITEKIFSWPGIGLELVEAIQKRDYPVVQGCVLVVAISYLVINFLTDLAYAWVDPRIRVTTGKR